MPHLQGRVRTGDAVQPAGQPALPPRLPQALHPDLAAAAGDLPHVGLTPCLAPATLHDLFPQKQGVSCSRAFLTRFQALLHLSFCQRMLGSLLCSGEIMVSLQYTTCQAHGSVWCWHRCQLELTPELMEEHILGSSLRLLAVAQAASSSLSVLDTCESDLRPREEMPAAHKHSTQPTPDQVLDSASDGEIQPRYRQGSGPDQDDEFWFEKPASTFETWMKAAPEGTGPDITAEGDKAQTAVRKADRKRGCGAAAACHRDDLKADLPTPSSSKKLAIKAPEEASPKEEVAPEDARPAGLQPSQGDAQPRKSRTAAERQASATTAEPGISKEAVSPATPQQSPLTSEAYRHSGNLDSAEQTLGQRPGGADPVPPTPKMQSICSQAASNVPLAAKHKTPSLSPAAGACRIPDISVGFSKRKDLPVMDHPLSDPELEKSYVALSRPVSSKAVLSPVDETAPAISEHHGVSGHMLADQGYVQTVSSGNSSLQCSLDRSKGMRTEHCLLPSRKIGRL